MKRSPEAETSGLVAGIRLAEKKMSKKTFRGSARDRAVVVQIGGDQLPREISISAKEFDLSKEQAQELEQALEEALRKAIENSQRAASRLLQEELS